MNRHPGGCWTPAACDRAEESPLVSVPSNQGRRYRPAPGRVVWVWARSGEHARAGGRAIRLRVSVVDARPLYAGWLWLFGVELDPAYRPAGVVDVLVEPDCLWPVTLDGRGEPWSTIPTS